MPVTLEKLELNVALLAQQWTQPAKPPNPQGVLAGLRNTRNLMVLNAGEKSGLCYLNLVGDALQMVAIPASRIVIDPPAAQKLVVRFGISDGAWQGGNHTDGVEFRISALSAATQARLIWSRDLTPLNRVADRGSQEATVDPRLAPDERMIFETLPVPGGNTDWAWSYWKDLDFQ